MDEPEDLPASAPEPEPPPLLQYGPPAAPPGGRTSPWVWVALTTGILALFVSVGSALVPLFMFALEDFEDEEFDEPGSSSYYVEQRSVIKAVEEPCGQMLDAAEEVTATGPTDRAAASLRRWTEVAQGIVAAIDSAEPNDDSRAWRDDWKSTIEAVNTFADNLGDPKNRLNLPDSVEDMFWETDAECGVPIVIASMDPDYAGWMLGE